MGVLGLVKFENHWVTTSFDNFQVHNLKNAPQSGIVTNAQCLMALSEAWEDLF